MKVSDNVTISMLDSQNGVSDFIYDKLLLTLESIHKDESGRECEVKKLKRGIAMQGEKSLTESFDPFFYYCEDCKRENSFFCKSYNHISNEICVLTFADAYDHTIRVIFSVEDVKTEKIITKQLVKLAQYPIKKLKIENSNKYRKELTEQQYEDYINAHIANYNNLNIASFLYLRRVFESLVLEVDSQKESTEKFKERVDRLVSEGKLNELFSDQGFSEIYKILSKHIHELTEEETLKVYKKILISVNRIIDEQISHKEKNKKDNELRNSLSNIAEETSSK